MPQYPPAYLPTFTCYGQWLHGDARGSVARVDGKRTTASLPRDPDLERLTRDTLVGQPYELNQQARSIALEAIVRVCRYRAWTLYAVHVRPTHVHVVLAAGLSPERVVGDLKAYSTRGLRDAGVVGARQCVWTALGSTRYLWDWEAVERAIRYVLDEQGERMAVFEMQSGG
jgi:REP element-mobilizing transposase RayT